MPMSKFNSPVILLLTMLLAAGQSVPEPVIEAQQPEVATIAVIEPPPPAQPEAEAEPIDYQLASSLFKNVQFAQPVGSGRFVHLEVPDQLNAMIETFIAQL